MKIGDRAVIIKECDKSQDRKCSVERCNFVIGTKGIIVEHSSPERGIGFRINKEHWCILKPDQIVKDDSDITITVAIQIAIGELR
jgi:hypothetical protein